jgi:hypothetical protein
MAESLPPLQQKRMGSVDFGIWQNAPGLRSC